VLQSKDLDWKAMMSIGIIVVLQIAIVLMRGVRSWFSKTYIPVARYIYPAILPLAVLMASGMDQIMQSLQQKTNLAKKVFYGTFIGLQLGIILWAMWSISVFYSL
jgi:hypothetical protein